jgi:hypothetical protein
MIRVAAPMTRGRQWAVIRNQYLDYLPHKLGPEETVWHDPHLNLAEVHSAIVHDSRPRRRNRRQDSGGTDPIERDRDIDVGAVT